eukprot:352252-Chlamydomonas_euryale.AAC.4
MPAVPPLPHFGRVPAAVQYFFLLYIHTVRTVILTVSGGVTSRTVQPCNGSGNKLVPRSMNALVWIFSGMKLMRTCAKKATQGCHKDTILWRWREDEEYQQVEEERKSCLIMRSSLCWRRRRRQLTRRQPSQQLLTLTPTLKASKFLQLLHLHTAPCSPMQPRAAHAVHAAPFNPMQPISPMQPHSAPCVPCDSVRPMQLHDGPCRRHQANVTQLTLYSVIMLAFSFPTQFQTLKSMRYG